MKIEPEIANALIRQRRSVFPKFYNEKAIPKNIIETILENANWAPTHKLTEPWRFRVYREKGLEKLSAFLCNYYKKNTPPNLFLEKKFEKNRLKPLQSSCVIAICMQRNLESGLPEWEEIAAVSCAVQNMWLTCTAYGIGSYWSSANSLQTATEFLQLEEGERCLGLFYMGYYEPMELKSKRSPIADKVNWIED